MNILQDWYLFNVINIVSRFRQTHGDKEIFSDKSPIGIQFRGKILKLFVKLHYVFLCFFFTQTYLKNTLLSRYYILYIYAKKY